MGRQPARLAILELALRPESGVPRYRQLYEAIRKAIVGGRIAPGRRLPSTRALAADVRCSRNTVVAFFMSLRARTSPYKEQADESVRHAARSAATSARSTWTYVEDFNPDLGAANKDHVERVEARLLEVSMVATPAYNAAAIEWVRSAEPMRARQERRRAADAWREELDKIRSTGR